MTEYVPVLFPHEIETVPPSDAYLQAESYPLSVERRGRLFCPFIHSLVVQGKVDRRSLVGSLRGKYGTTVRVLSTIDALLEQDGLEERSRVGDKPFDLDALMTLHDELRGERLPPASASARTLLRALLDAKPLYRIAERAGKVAAKQLDHDRCVRLIKALSEADNDLRSLISKE